MTTVVPVRKGSDADVKHSYIVLTNKPDKVGENGSFGKYNHKRVYGGCRDEVDALAQCVEQSGIGARNSWMHTFRAYLADDPDCPLLKEAVRDWEDRHLRKTEVANEVTLDDLTPEPVDDPPKTTRKKA